ncbi:Gfo/Idh/MocA family oxidoreductase [Streptomyces sp. NPDC051940]|uniref:Gfo/Idh/MocA family protein n=1 Tax=Streptomyces sp. NPDC051940 TaxID=3155675 RepID=UPI003443FED6
MRFALLGTGPWAEVTHGPALREHPGVSLAGVWGRRPEAAKALADTLGVPAYDDADELIRAADAVAVALPPDVQAEYAVRAARAGKHLLLDKPVATTVEGARAVTEAAGEAGVASVVFFTLRFAEESARWVADRTAEGGWLHGRAEWFSPVFGGADSPYAASPWRKEKGALWDIGPHALSMLLPVLGDAREVHAVRGPGDAVHLTLRHTGGALSHATLTMTVPPAASGVAVEVRGREGIAVMPERDADGPVAAFRAAVDALLLAARTGTPHPCDVRFGQRVTEILATAEGLLTA